MSKSTTALLLAAALIVPVAAHTAPNDIPTINVSPSCRAAARDAGPSEEKITMDGCLQAESRARDQLVQEWPQFTQADRRTCFASVQGFEPTYSEFITCLEMERDLRNPPSAGVKPTLNKTRGPDTAQPATQNKM
jgi:hypothetical protein